MTRTTEKYFLILKEKMIVSDGNDIIATLDCFENSNNNHYNNLEWC